MIASDALERLIALGRAKGGLDTEDLRRALPLQRMSPEDVALVVLQIEEAGVAVELEESLLAGATSRRPAVSTPPPTVDLPGATPTIPSAPPGSAAATPTPSWPPRPDAAPAAASAASHVPPGRATHWAVLVAAALLALLFAALWWSYA
ncbi:MAG TPA: RNA polymerase sigma factor region1.1 domain-containing protein [Beijerinckiaceae bacterium]